MARVFDGDGDGKTYATWVDRHPHGFVVNTPRAPDERSENLVLHRSGCMHIAHFSERYPPSCYTEGNNIKVCAETVDELRVWVKTQGRNDGSFSKECGTCHPLSAVRSRAR